MVRRVTLRAEVDGDDRRFLDAWLDDEGALHIDGQDLGPATAIVSRDGEYEWGRTIAAHDIPKLVEELGGRSGEGDDVLELLLREWSGIRTYELERVLRETDIPVALWVWSG